MRTNRLVLALTLTAQLACGDDEDSLLTDAEVSGALPDGGAPPSYEGARDLDAAAGMVMDAALPPSSPTGLPVRDAGDAGAPATAPDASAPDAAPDAALPAVCPPDACPLSDYPCVASDDGQGYTCEGQFAAWPMPDAEPGAKTAPRYSVREAEGEVLDEVTGLAWQRDLPATYAGCTRQLAGMAGDACTWDQAKRYCEQLSLGGKRWRLPTKIELESLVDMTKPLRDAKIADVFPATSVAKYWTGSRVRWLEDASYYDVSFLTGATSVVEPNEAKRVRCVRTERVPNAPATQRWQTSDDMQTIADRFTGLTWQRVAHTGDDTLEQARAFCESVGARLPTHKELLTLSDVTSASTAEFAVFPALEEAGLLWSSTPFPGGGDTLVVGAALGITTLASIDDPSFPKVLYTRCVR